MNKTLLIVQSFERGKSQVDWAYPYWKSSGWDIVGMTATDSRHEWPEGIQEVHFGKNGYMGIELVKRWVETFAWCVHHDEHDNFCIIEYDGVIVRTPEKFEGGLLTKHAVGPQPHFGLLSKIGGFHSPWWVDKITAQIIYDEGMRCISKGTIEGGSPDMLLGLICERSSLTYKQANVFSVNGGSISQFGHLEKARKAYREGVWYIHGFRKKEELDYVLKP